MICRERHSEEYCAMYDICGAREDGKVVNCPVGSPSVKVSGFSFLFSFLFLLILIIWMLHFAIFPEYASTFFFFYQPDDLLSQKIQSLCPTITGNVCCSEAQFETLRSQVQQVRRLSGNKIEYMCTCLRSFLSVWFMFCRQFHFWSAVQHVWETFWICSVNLPVPRIRACLLTWLLRIRFAIPTVLVGFTKRS